MFSGDLIIRDHNGFPFSLVEPLSYRSERFETTFIVPAGFKTDYASIPRVLWNVLPPVGSYDRAAVIHDFLYQTAPDVNVDGTFMLPHACSRATADRILLDAMEELGTSRAARWAIYSGVRAGGWAVWNRYRHASRPK